MITPRKMTALLFLLLLGGLVWYFRYRGKGGNG
jgi:cbb3-type cytochrome oxidase subunit 3